MFERKIYIYHTNDIHSDLTYWPRIANELVAKRAIHEAKGHAVFAFDVGDAMDRVHPLTEATDGQSNVARLNEGQFDAVTIGNNEGITNSKEELNALYQDANFPVVLANLYDLETKDHPKWAQPYKIFKTSVGDRIGVFGLTAPLTETYEQLGWKVTNPAQEIQDFRDQHKDKADFWILLSHLGLETDRYLSKIFTIPLIIGAHTHHALQMGEIVGETMLTGAGQFGQWLGEIIISDTPSGLKIESAKLFNAKADLQAVADETDLKKSALAQGHTTLEKDVFADYPEDLHFNWYEQTELADLTLDAIADFAGTDAAIINAGLLMCDIPQGKITADHLHRALPHPIRVMRCKIQGQHLLKAKAEIKRIDQQIMNQAVKGFGFRGKIFGKLCLKGLTIEANRLKWLGEEIKPQEEYVFTTIDYFSFLPFFSILNRYSEKEVLFPDFIRTVVKNYLKKEYPIKNEKE